VPRPDLCEPLARVLQSLGVRRAMVVCGKIGSQKSEVGNYLDELSTLGENTIAEFFQERGFTVSTTAPEQFPLQPATLADLLGGDKNQNAGIVRRILAGDERGPKRDAVLLNAAAALFVAGKTKSLLEGWALAAETIDGGQAKAKLAELAG
jgi:anthranilate phosphoribosyltransferase